MFAAMVFGPRPASVAHFYVDTWDRGATAGRSVWNSVIPDTTAGWGVLSVIGSFILLGVGAAISLLKGGLTDDPAPESAAPEKSRAAVTQSIAACK
jgi:hypothetical protein